MFTNFLPVIHEMERAGRDQQWDQLRDLQRTTRTRLFIALHAASAIVDPSQKVYTYDLVWSKQIVTTFIHELGASAGLALLTSARIGLHAVVHFGDEHMKRKYVVPTLRGELGFSLAVSEPRVGTDIQRIETMATKHDDRTYRISGVKKWISGALFSDYFVVFSRVGTGYGMFVVASNQSSVQVQPIEYQGAHGSGGSVVTFDNAVVSDVLTLTQGLEMLADVLLEERWMTGLVSVESARSALDAAIAGTKSRSLHGKPIWSKQIVRSRLATMWSTICMLDALADKTTTLLQKYRDTTTTHENTLKIQAEVAMFKCMAVLHAQQVVHHASHLLGGRSYEVGDDMSPGHVIERLHRITIGLNCAGGSYDPLMDSAIQYVLKSRM